MANLTAAETNTASPIWCREEGSVASHTHYCLSADLHGWQEATAGPSTLPAPAGSSDSTSLTSGPSA